MKRVKTLFIVILILIVPVISFSGPKKKGSQPPKEEIPPLVPLTPPPSKEELPPLVPLTPPPSPTPSKKSTTEKQIKEETTEKEKFRVIEAHPIESLKETSPTMGLTSKAGGAESKSGSEDRLKIDSSIGLMYDSNILDLSLREMVAFSKGTAFPDYILNGTYGYRIKGYVDFATTPSVGLTYRKHISGEKDTIFNVYASGKFYMQNSILNNGYFSLGVKHPFNDKLKLSILYNYMPERYFRELIYPEPYLNPILDAKYKTAKYSSFVLPLTMSYTFSDKFEIEGGYTLSGRYFTGDFSYRSRVAQGAILKGRLSLKNRLLFELLLSGLYSNAKGDNPTTSYRETDPTSYSSLIGAYLSYRFSESFIAGITNLVNIEAFTTNNIEDIQYYKRMDILFNPAIYLRYRFSNSIGLELSYSFTQNDASTDQEGVSINGVGDYQRQLILFSVSYGDTGPFNKNSFDEHLLRAK